jgi:hypothetical protein
LAVHREIFSSELPRLLALEEPATCWCKSRTLSVHSPVELSHSMPEMEQAHLLVELSRIHAATLAPRDLVADILS